MHAVVPVIGKRHGRPDDAGAASAAVCGKCEHAARFSARGSDGALRHDSGVESSAVEVIRLQEIAAVAPHVHPGACASGAIPIDRPAVDSSAVIGE